MYTNHVKIGTVVSKHGYKGDIKISVSSNNLVTFPDLKYLFIELDDCFIPFKIDNVRSFSKNVLIVKLEEIRSEDEVDEVIHKNIYVDSTEIESNIDSGFLYFFMLCFFLKIDFSFSLYILKLDLIFISRFENFSFNFLSFFLFLEFSIHFLQIISLFTLFECLIL